MAKISVLGAGSWGTALAIHLASQGHEVILWARRREAVARMEARRANEVYLAGVPFPENLELTTDLGRAAGAEITLLVVPSHGYRRVVRDFLRLAEPGERRTIVSGAKGIELETLQRMSEVTAAEAQAARVDLRFAVLSGPNFAAELATGTPSAAVLASDDLGLAKELQRVLASQTYRLYASPDVIGVELGGAAKNVIAIGAGIVSGLGFGHNTLAALITRGLAEIARLGAACGGDVHTFYGLAGLGDLVLTCTGGLSRNRKTGMDLAAGKSLAEILSGTTTVSEGVRNSVAIHQYARQRGVEMPIIEQMVAVMYEDKSPRQALDDLMRRELRTET